MERKATALAAVECKAASDRSALMINPAGENRGIVTYVRKVRLLA
jgi:hypothetical protein